MPQTFAEELKSIPMSPSLGKSLESAHRFAREQSHRLVGLEHLLLALGEDPEAIIILQSANVDMARLSADVSGYLGRLMDDMRGEAGIEPRPDPELLRVLKAAASAAQQSRRRQIDGAIVLAAIVGDGKSPAAGLLKALGMTFEEAIRALQRANAQARLKPKRVEATAAATPAPVKGESDQRPAAQSTSGEADPPERVPAPTEPEEAPAQTHEEFLAAARARIQRRATAAGGGHAGNGAPSASSNTSSTLMAGKLETAGLNATSLAEAIKAVAAGPVAPSDGASTASEPALSPSPAKVPAPQENLTVGAPRPVRAHGAPQREGRPQAPPPSPTLRPNGAPPFPPRPTHAADAAAYPPPPIRPAAVANGPQGKLPHRPTRAPWPEQGEHGGGVRPPSPNGSFAGVHYPALDPANSASLAPARTGAAHRSDRGPLIESVPRRMRVGVQSIAEVRIARDKIEALILALRERETSFRPERIATRALSVRLRAPNGGFFIEPESAETQWVENSNITFNDDYAAWRWTVIPQRRGRGRLVLTVSARTVGHDGVAVESAPPDRAIDVRVRPNHLRRIARWCGWLLALLLGAALITLGREIWPSIVFVLKSILG